MHAIAQSLAHRAPPASRTRARWQPYSSISSSSSSSSSSFSVSSAKSSPLSYINTPATSTPSSYPPSTQPSLICEQDSSRQGVSINPPSSKDTPANKNKFALSLVDQAVKTLSDIWRPNDIPAVFNNPKSKHTISAFDSSATPAHLSSVRSALAQSPISTPSTSQPSVPTTQVLLQSGTSDVRSHLVPIRGFVHEVLRRSRTSGCVLQTAMCYIEAIRSKIPELLQQELQGNGVKGEPEPTSQITIATEEELRQEAEYSATHVVTDWGTIRFDDAIMDTIRVTSSDSFTTTANDSQSQVPEEPPLTQPSTQPIPPTQATPLASKSPSPPLEPLPPLPSPLLCPRRAFLAALILASKFTQDKCYSNRAWAKLSGLPPREIGRCERALGNALEWRLWVGKSATTSQASSSSTASQRSIVRCQSEPSLNMSALATAQSTLARHDVSLATVPESPQEQLQESRKLRRSSTLPADVFTGPQQISSGPVSCRRLVDVERQVYAQQPWSSYPSIPEASTPSDTATSSPGSDVPGLSYSPSSTVSSSSSEGTGQMSTFLEDMPPPGDKTQSWAWLEFAEGNHGSAGYLSAASANCAVTSLSPVARVNTKVLHGNSLLALSKSSLTPAPLATPSISIRPPVDPMPPPHSICLDTYNVGQGQHNHQWDRLSANEHSIILTSTA